ncbi:hypothetical protein CANINC_003629 [Pichia inconspicua]|uniref:Temperature shock-inducible protein 1 n=1 Tax=Pichia inconspicua TaxID=52247 RepID=A0A4T0WYA3_9ASCO|nr:hypothetical protein CANINC_003629 [[Candida] inconspicua]
MQYSAVLSLAAFIAGISAENILVVLNSDINANLNDYLGYVQQNTEADIGPLLSIYRQAQTYTDEAYTTLVDAQEYAAISSFAEQLPWYSSRIESNLDVASVAPSTTEESVAPSTTHSASHSEESHTGSHSDTHTGSHSGTHTGTHSGTHSASATTSASATNAAAYLAPGAGLLALGAFALL